MARYDDAWQTRRGDFSGVSLADGFRFTGPVASFDSADGYGLMVLTLNGDRIAATGFPDTSVFAHFGLPRTLRN